MLELYRAIIPENHIINDNHGQHYRVHMGNLQWLTDQWHMTRSGYYTKWVGRGQNRHEETIPYLSPFEFYMPQMNKVHKYLGIKIDEKSFGEFTQEGRELYAEECGGVLVNLECQVFRPTNRVFDAQNYAKTFKAPLDLLVHHGYLPDDSWKYVNRISYCGGGWEAWKRYVNTFDAEMPKELTSNLWREQLSKAGINVSGGKDDFNHILIRILVESLR